MKITNDLNLPAPFLRALENDDYDPGFSDITATGLLTAPRIAELRRRHAAELTIEASRIVPSLIGKAFHALMEAHAGPGEIAEARLYSTCRGKLVGGAVDLQVLSEGVKVIDYKVVKVAALTNSIRKWEEQLNIYGWLACENGKPVIGLEIVAVLKDWQEARMGPDYPASPVVVVPIRLWPFRTAGEFVADLVYQHERAKKELPLCSDEDRWIHPDKFKAGKKFFETKAEAAATGKEVSVIKGQPIMCQRNYCLVAEYCEQWRKERGL